MSGLLSAYADRACWRPCPRTRCTHTASGPGACFNLLRFILTGGYVNFGVFGVYQDPAFDIMLATFVRLAAVPDDGPARHPKVSAAFTTRWRPDGGPRLPARLDAEAFAC